METIEYSFKDKSSWGNGPWQSEPDKVLWQDESTKLPCLVIRPYGALCGYVGVPLGHPWHGRDYSDVENEVEVHGGLTFSSACNGDEERGVCHKPAPGEPENVWWFGFDCNHAWDLDPSYYARHPQESVLNCEEYRDLSYVRSQVSLLALQLASIKPE